MRLIKDRNYRKHQMLISMGYAIILCAFLLLYLISLAL